MAARDALNRQLFDPYGDLRSVPAPFGSKPVPEGHVLVNHYTSDESVPSIMREGLKISRAQESFKRGGTEFPSTFATAGHPTEKLLKARPVVEAHIPVKDLDIGSREDPRRLESNQSIVTTNVDVAPENIVGVHQPWHGTLRYIQGSPQMEHGIMSGHYDDSGDEDADRAVRASKLALSAKVMLGGQLGRF